MEHQAAALASHAPADAAPTVGPERAEETQDAADADVVSQLSRLSVAGAETDPCSPRSPRTPKDACVVCWERRREVACYPCMCVAASQRFPLILPLTPRLRGDTPSPRVVSMSDPRRHVCLCAACAGAADACPMCRRPVEDVFRVFLS